MTTPLTDVRYISRIAYGFIGSKALFAALNLDLFSHLARGGKSLENLVANTRVAPNRLRILLSALCGMGLVVREADAYRNAPAAERYLVRGAPAYFGDYYRLQINRQLYPALVRLDDAIRGDAQALELKYENWFADSEEAEAFTLAQHAGSMGPALLLAKQLDLQGARALLDVGGGSGAFSIALLRRNPSLHATLLDFPNVVSAAQRFVAESGLQDRIAYARGDALETPWPSEQDLVLMSYLLSSVAEGAIPLLIDKAWQALRPGGRLLIHDFMLDDDEGGPALAALWFVLGLAGRIDGACFTAADLTGRMHERGFDEISDQVLIPEITKLIVAVKPIG